MPLRADQDSLSRSFGRDVIYFLDPEINDPLNGGNTWIHPYPVKPFLIQQPGQGYFPEGRAREGSSADWFFWLIVVALSLVAFTRFFFEKRLKVVISSIFSRSSSFQATRERSITQHQSFYILALVFVIACILLIYQIILYFDPSGGKGVAGLLLTVQVFAAWIVYFLFKVLFVRLSGIIFRNSSVSSEYIQNIFLYNIVTGIILVPVLLLLAYVEAGVFLYTALGVLVIMMILRFIRGMLIGLSDTKFSLFHLILYLCTLEILPILFIAKFAEIYFLS